MRHAHEMPFGTRLHPGGGVAFRLWAPAVRQADVLLHHADGTPPAVLAARPEDDGWWTCEAPQAGAGSRYQWRIDGATVVPDPASRDNPDGPEAPSRVVDPMDFEWDDAWNGRPWSEVVLYELHVGTFTPEGTLDAAAADLPRLQALGITAIELMPLASFPGRFGWGYDGVLPFAPQAGYGGPQALKRFVAAAHRLGLMVFLDVVYNHFGPQGNMLSHYAPAFFSTTRSSPWGAAINFDGEGSRTVREFFIHNALYWVQEFRIDGLRLDAVHAIQDDSALHVLDELSQRVRAATAGRHVHLVLENENNGHHHLAAAPRPGRYDAQWNDDFHHALHVALTGETQGYYHDYGAVDPIDLLGRSLAHGMLFEDAERKPGGARVVTRPAPPQHLPALVNFAHNHDQVGNRAFGERLAALLPPEAGLLPTLLVLLTPAVPLLFFGEEWGATEPFLYFADWQGELREAVRAGRQREFGHVQGPQGQPLPDACSEATFAASRPDRARAATATGRAWQEAVRAALAARRQWIIPRQHLLLPGVEHTVQRVGATGLAVQWRYGDGCELALELNLGPEAVAASPQRVGPVEAELVHAHRRGAGDAAWPAWSARWTLGPEITL